MNAKIRLALSMSIFGTIGLFVRNIPLPSGELALYRALLAIALITGYLALSRQQIPFSSILRAVPLLLISGAAMGLNWILLFQAYRYTTISIATLSYYFAPVLVMAACPILFHEKMTRRKALCSAMSTLGLVLIIGVGGVSGGAHHILGILLGLGAACFYAAVIILNKFIKNVAGIHRTLLQFWTAALILFPYVMANGGTHIGELKPIGWLCLLIVGLLHTGITYCMYFSSIKELPGQEAAILSYIDPVVAVLASTLFLHEGISPLQLLGGAMILFFTLLNEF